MTQKHRNDAESPQKSQEKALGGTADKKERVLHTRVPASLEKELKRFADHLRVPVSNLVRTILEDALAAAAVPNDRVEERLRKAAEQLEPERTKLKQRAPRPDPLAMVLAFQEVTLAQRGECAKCGVRLVAGSPAFLGLSDGSNTSHIFACRACLPTSDTQSKSQSGAT